MMATTTTSTTTVVLFANGIGGHPHTYRPHADSSQWWNRRDALVRCVTAFLFSGTDGSFRGNATLQNENSRSITGSIMKTDIGSVSKELIILFDEDWSYFSMTFNNTTPPPLPLPPPPSTTTTTSSKTTTEITRTLPTANHSDFIPNESNIIHLWKFASQNPGVRIVQKENGLSCLLCVPVTTTTITTTTSTQPPNSTRTVDVIPTMYIDSFQYNSNQQQQQQHNEPLPNRLKTTSTGDLVDAVANCNNNNNKRSVIEYLQTNCSIEFLRQHKLNSTLETLARKLNRTKLLKIKGIWEQNQENNTRKKQKISPEHVGAIDTATISPTTDTAVNSGNRDTDPQATAERSASLLKGVIQHVLKPQSTTTKVIAATLHESSRNEFPCWDEDNGENNIASNQPLHICFFLGAVRDMYKSENRIVRQVCDTNHVPLLRIRFGPVSEFTSKILSVLSYHTSNHRLLLGMERSISRNQQSEPNARTTTVVNLVGSNTQQQPATIILHYVCHVPMAAHLVTSNLSHRNRLMWCIVRCTVTCLWRSRFAGEKQNGESSTTALTALVVPPTNKLSFLFSDGVILTMDQNDLVHEMAQQHQAAPSEYQILATIRSRLDLLLGQRNEKIKISTTKDPLHPLSVQHSLFYDTSNDCWKYPNFLIDFIVHPQKKTECYFYKPMDKKQQYSDNMVKYDTKISPTIVVICIPLRSESYTTDDFVNTDIVGSTVRHNILTTACTKFHKPTNNHRVVHISGRCLVNIDDDHSIDREGTTITMIQHLAYQGRLTNLCYQIAAVTQND